MKTNTNRNWWIREIISILFKLHPVILMLLGLLEANEAFLVLGLSYLIGALVFLVRSGFIFGYQCVQVRFPQLSGVFLKIAEAVGYFIGWVFASLFHLFLILLFFGLLYDAVERQDYATRVFDGPDGALLLRTLLINAAWFLLIEIIDLVKFIRAYLPETHSLRKAFLFGLDMTETRGKQWLPFIWLLVFDAFFIFMCTGFAFRVAIWSFFVFDIGFVFLQRWVARTKNPAQTS